MGQIEIFNHFLYLKLLDSIQTNQLLIFDNNTWNHLTVSKQMSPGSFKNNVTYKLFVYKLYIFDIYMYKQIWY